MDTQNAPKPHGTRRAENNFLETLRRDPDFRRDASRTGLLAMIAFIVDAAMFGLIGSGREFDANTHQVIVFTSFVATSVVVSAIVWYVVRVTDEYCWFYIDRMER